MRLLDVVRDVLTPGNPEFRDSLRNIENQNAVFARRAELLADLEIRAVSDSTSMAAERLSAGNHRLHG